MGVVILRIHHQVSYFKFSLQLKCLLDKLMRRIIQRKNRKSNPRPILENEFKDQKSKSFLSYKLDLQSRLFPLTIFLISSKSTFFNNLCLTADKDILRDGEEAQCHQICEKLPKRLLFSRGPGAGAKVVEYFRRENILH